MKKAVLVLATAATVGITALATSSPAQAWRRGWDSGPAGGPIAAGMVGGIPVGVPVRGPGYCYYRPLGDGDSPGPYFGPWYYGRQCYMGYQYGR